MLAFPSLMTAVSLRAPPGAQGRYQGLHALAFSVGMTLGPLLGARISAAHGWGALWLCAAGLALGVAALLGALPEQRETAA
jgi:MFS family permease